VSLPSDGLYSWSQGDHVTGAVVFRYFFRACAATVYYVLIVMVIQVSIMVTTAFITCNVLSKEPHPVNGIGISSSRYVISSSSAVGSGVSNRISPHLTPSEF
jgi:hypothetical protein